MLIPKFSISWILGLIAACAIFFVVVAAAFRGSVVAMSITGSVAIAVSCFVLFALTFVSTYGLAGLMKSLRRGSANKTPFAEAGVLPPQAVPQSPNEPTE